MARTAITIGILVVIAAAAMAGCVDDPASGPPEPTGPAAPLWRFADAVPIVELRNVQSESFIAVSPDATTRLTCLHGEFKEPSIMIASTDSGANWRELTATPSPGVGGDCEVALTSDDGWHFLHTQAAGIVVASTFDGGATWRVNTAAGPPVATFSDRPWIEAAGESLVLTYSGFAGITARTSEDSGESWGLPQVVARAIPEHVPLSGHLVIGPEGRTAVQPYLQVPVEHSEGTPTTVRPGVAVSTDLGATWSDIAIGGSVQALPLHPAVAIDASGTIHYSFLEANGSLLDLRVRSSDDAGATWSDPWSVKTGMERAGRAWADARADGLVDFLVQAWEAPNASAEPEWRINLVRVDPEASAPYFEHTVGTGHNEFVSLTHDASSRAYVVFTEVSGSLTSGPADGSALWAVEETAASPESGR